MTLVCGPTGPFFRRQTASLLCFGTLEGKEASAGYCQVP